MPRQTSRIVVACALLVCTDCALGQRSEENATRSAEDAFGTSIGDQQVGLYSPADVRGFSPIAAGNVRIEGLYFDQQGWLSDRIVQNSKVRVGITAQGYPFPAPTGIVDNRLREQTADPTLSVVLGYGPFSTSYTELDTQIPLSAQLALAGGFSIHDNDRFDGTTERFRGGGAVARWRS